jgi:sugar phosphate isomerase/epimerase
VLDVSAAEAIDAAHQAGFDGCGLRPTADELSPASLRRLRQHLDDSGLTLLDVEVVRLRGDDDASAHLRLLDAAAVLGAGHVLAVSEHLERSATIEAMAWLASQAGQRGLRIALEFMVFTSVRSLADALDVIAAAATGNIGVLVDALHLARSGGTPADLARVPDREFAYVQLCDAPREPPQDLTAEARHYRLLPGDGDLPLVALAEAVGVDVPLSVEVQSDELTSSTSATTRARRALTQTRRLLHPGD